MGLIKTGLALAGSYGLIKAASKAANDYEDKKLKRNTQAQQSRSYEPQMNYGPAINGPSAGYYQGQGYVVTRNVPFDGNSQHSNEPNYSHGHEPQRNHASNMSGPPPPYHQGKPCDMQRNADPRPAQHSQQYYASDSKR
ncbi:hypothetical protein N7467_009414 [Penicillium canescens]|nr:hypothetical protein N7467_009414 [Penicillium canescens]